MDFLDIISQFTGHPKEKIGVYVIHLEKAVERLPLMNEFNNSLNVRPEIIVPEDGNVLIKLGHYNVNSVGGHQPGSVVSCTRSHVMACKKTLEQGKEYCVIFEDDIIFNKTLQDFSNIILQVKNVVNTYAIKWDIFLLGALGYPSHLPNSIGISQVYNFHGTHALILNKNAMKEYITSYYKSLVNNSIEPADGLYDKIISEGLVCIGFTDSKLLFDQKQNGMWSYIGECVK